MDVAIPLIHPNQPFNNPILDVWVIGTNGTCYVHQSYSNVTTMDDYLLSAFLSAIKSFIQSLVNDTPRQIKIISNAYELQYQIFDEYLVILLTKKDFLLNSEIMRILNEIGNDFDYYFSGYLKYFQKPTETKLFDLFKTRIDQICHILRY